MFQMSPRQNILVADWPYRRTFLSSTNQRHRHRSVTQPGDVGLRSCGAAAPPPTAPLLILSAGWSADMITTPLFGVCWLPNNCGAVATTNKLLGQFVWNRQQCFLTLRHVQSAAPPYVGFWNTVAIFQPSSSAHSFTMETRLVWGTTPGVATPRSLATLAVLLRFSDMYLFFSIFHVVDMKHRSCVSVSKNLPLLHSLIHNKVFTSNHFIITCP